ncbi:MAG: hypothetical protein B7Z16_14105, partial [Algoriphagus sp. 32-45-6]
EAGSEEVSEEDLKKYAAMEVKTAQFVAAKTDELRKMIVENEIFQGGARYNEIKAAWGDEAKMNEANVTDEEKAAYQAVQDFQSSLTDTVKEYKTELIMDEEVLGAGTYNKVLAATKEDPAIKEKLDQLINELKEEAEEDGQG